MDEPMRKSTPPEIPADAPRGRRNLSQKQRRRRFRARHTAPRPAEPPKIHQPTRERIALPSFSERNQDTNWKEVLGMLNNVAPESELLRLRGGHICKPLN